MSDDAGNLPMAGQRRGRKSALQVSAGVFTFVRCATNPPPPASTGSLQQRAPVGARSYDRAAIAYWGKVACFRRLPLAFLVVFTSTFDSWRCGLNWVDSRKSLCFNDITTSVSGFFRKFHDMRIFGPVRSPEKRGQPPILAPHCCWKQWGSTRQTRIVVLFFFVVASIREVNP